MREASLVQQALPMAPRPAAARSSVQMAEMSKCMPFMKAPPALDGSMAGDVGFDPLGISTTIMELGGDLKYVREAELTHGRLAMLAAAGVLATDIGIRLPGEVYGSVTDTALQAQLSIPPEAHAQLAITVAISEGLRSMNVLKPDHVPGDHGFDPLGFKKKMDGTAYETMQLKEVKNGRLAMLAIMGMFAQELVTGKGPISQLF